jgi:membrane protease YdiL (CAAX protease family)
VTEPVVPPSIAGTIGRVVAFVVLLVLCVTIGALMLSPPLTWLAARAGQRLRVDYYGQLAGVAAATWIMLRGVDHRPWADVDLGENAARPRLFGIGWLAGMAAIATTCGLLFISGLLHFVPAIVAGGGWLGAAVRVTLVLLPAALAEEMATRGYLLTVLRERMGARAAVITTSVGFGLLHLTNPGWTLVSLSVVMLAGVFLATVRLALGSMYAAWMAHLAWNWVMAVPLHAYVSGQRLEAPGYRAVAAGPEWLSGGRWGPEGGLVAALGLIAGLAYFHARRRREES